MLLVVALVVVFLSLSNGSNDNFKGVATIYGSGSASYRVCLAWATITTLAGSLLALILAAGLVKTFSAKGLVPDAVASSPTFLAAAALGAASTVLLATRLGFPVSTTHALTGALVGAGFVCAGSAVNLGVLGKTFFLPLLLGPVIAVVIVTCAYPLARSLRRGLGVERHSCVCVAGTWTPLAAVDGQATAAPGSPAVVSCDARDRYLGTLFGLTAQRALDGLHFVSAGAVGFARGLNDTPKIVAIIIAAKALPANTGLAVAAFAMVLGGLLGARRVAETMSKKITTLNAGQGFVANVTAATLVLLASLKGLPVSTTHVTTGGIFGIGLVNRSARWAAVTQILLAWLITLPTGAALGALALYALRRFA